MRKEIKMEGRKEKREGKKERMGREDKTRQEKAKKKREDQTSFSLAPEEFHQWGLPGFASGSLQILDIHFP